jgi:hypothetical protein
MKCSCSVYGYGVAGKIERDGNKVNRLFSERKPRPSTFGPVDESISDFHRFSLLVPMPAAILAWIFASLRSDFISIGGDATTATDIGGLNIVALA